MWFLSSTLFFAALVHVLNAFVFQSIFETGCPNIRVSMMLKENKSRTGSLTEALQSQKQEPASCPIRCPAAQQVLVPVGGAAKVAWWEDNTSSEY